ncbi:hypothetical protein K1719_017395 [Acacia pycnantha]|nr:hypothetical protein K1719_017395 [Acacia pycnantha]
MAACCVLDLLLMKEDNGQGDGGRRFDYRSAIEDAFGPSKLAILLSMSDDGGFDGVVFSMTFASSSMTASSTAATPPSCWMPSFPATRATEAPNPMAKSTRRP